MGKVKCHELRTISKSDLLNQLEALKQKLSEVSYCAVIQHIIHAVWKKFLSIMFRLLIVISAPSVDELILFYCHSDDDLLCFVHS